MAERASSADPQRPADGGRQLSRARGALGRRVAAAVAVAALVGLLAGDVWAPAVRSWWDGHSFTADAASNLLVVAVTVLLFDEVLARRQRKERSLSVAVQALIVYGQAVRTWQVVMELVGSAGTRAETETPGEVREEIRSLANMILIASPVLFDDPEARLLLEEVQRLAGTMYARVAGPGPGSDDGLGGTGVAAGLKDGRERIDARMRPLVARVPREDRAGFQEMSAWASEWTSAPSPPPKTAPTTVARSNPRQ